MQPQLSLLASKLSLPRLPATLLRREHLLQMLQAGRENTLTLISAPAGSGKTTLVAQWLRETSQDAISQTWVALDAGDNDPVRFWSYIIAACQRALNGCDQQVSLQAAERALLEQQSWRTVLTLLINESGQWPGSLILVLEDYHVITCELIHEALSFFLENLPSNLHLVMITRTDPPFSLARLRAGGTLHEIRAAHLRFTSQELDLFLQQTLRISLPPAMLRELDTRLQGWATGLRMLALRIGEQTERSVSLEYLLATFSGQHQYMLEYFVTEVLHAQSVEVQRFLLQTCVLDRLTASLCDAVTERSDSAHLLAELEKAQLFLTRLEGDEVWYRYHPLFAEALQHEARLHLDEESSLLIVRRASEWYEMAGLHTEAIEAALQTGAYDRAADLLEKLIGPQRLHESPEHRTHERWLKTLPDEVLNQHPALELTLAMLLLFANDCQMPISRVQLAEIEQKLQRVEQTWNAQGNRQGLSEVLAFRGVMAQFQGDREQAARFSQAALPDLAADAHQWRGSCLSAIAHAQVLAGEMTIARQTLRATYMHFLEAGNDYGRRITMLESGNLCWLRGELHQAAEWYREVEVMAGSDQEDLAKARLGLARLAYEWNDLIEAETLVREVFEIADYLANETLSMQASLLLGAIEQAQGKGMAARKSIAASLARTQQHSSLDLYCEVLLQQVRIAIQQGDFLQAQRWLEEWKGSGKDRSLLQEEEEALLRASLYVKQGKASEVLEQLHYYYAIAQRQGRGRSELTILLLLSLAQASQQKLPQALAFLRRALQLAEGEGYKRSFLDLGEEMIVLLRTMLAEAEKTREASYARALLLTTRSEQPPHIQQADNLLAVQAIEPLSPQEERILTLLTQGLSNPEIARAMIVSSNTVKSQVQSIYRKLNVHSRQEIRALMRGLRRDRDYHPSIIRNG